MTWLPEGKEITCLLLLSLTGDTCLSSSPGIFKQLDPENTGTIQLDLISVSAPPPRSDGDGRGGPSPGGRTPMVGWLTCCLKALGTGLNGSRTPEALYLQPLPSSRALGGAPGPCSQELRREGSTGWG